MLGSNVLVRKALSLLGSVSQNLLADGLDRGMRTQEPEGESFVFAQQSQQQVLRLYVRRTELTALVARKEDDALCFLRVPFKHEPSPRQVRNSGSLYSVPDCRFSATWVQQLASQLQN